MTPEELNQDPALAESFTEDGSMPPGFQQLPEHRTPTRAEKVKHYAIVYSLSTLGFVLSPIAFALRLGRWSMRTLWCHHAGHEFGRF